MNGTGPGIGREKSVYYAFSAYILPATAGLGKSKLLLLMAVSNGPSDRRCSAAGDSLSGVRVPRTARSDPMITGPPLPTVTVAHPACVYYGRAGDRHRAERRRSRRVSESGTVTQAAWRPGPDCVQTARSR